VRLWIVLSSIMLNIVCENVWGEMIGVMREGGVSR
jgi:hypothetical protein